MKSLVRIVALFVAVTLGLVVAPALTTKAHAAEFTDVPVGSKFYAEIQWMSDEGISTGYSDGTFRPLSSVTREAMAAFLYRFHNSPSWDVEDQIFSDVPPSDTYYTEIDWLAWTGITSGYPDGTYRPRSPVTREAMAAFLYRSYGSPAFTPSAQHFKDVKAGSKFYKEVEWLASTGITTGWLDGTFRPTQSIARNAMAAFLYRAWDELGWPEPAPPTNLTATVVGTTVVLDWDDNTEADLLGYAVWRTVNPAGQWELLTPESLLTASTYTDENPPSGTVYYSIAALDTNYNQSGYTDVDLVVP